MSVFFHANSKWGYKSLASSVTDLKVANVNTREIWHDEAMNTADFVNISAEATINNESLTWSYYKDNKDKATYQPKFFKDAFVSFMEQFTTKDDHLPVLAYYSDSYPHVDDVLRGNIRVMIDNDDLLERSWGYYHWDFDTSCATIWQKRFMRIYRLHASLQQMLAETEDKKSVEALTLSFDITKLTHELSYIKEYLKRFTNNESHLLADRSDAMKICRDKP